MFSAPTKKPRYGSHFSANAPHQREGDEDHADADEGRRDERVVGRGHGLRRDGKGLLAHHVPGGGGIGVAERDEGGRGARQEHRGEADDEGPRAEHRVAPVPHPRHRVDPQGPDYRERVGGREEGVGDDEERLVLGDVLEQALGGEAGRRQDVLRHEGPDEEDPRQHERRARYPAEVLERPARGPGSQVLRLLQHGEGKGFAI